MFTLYTLKRQLLTVALLPLGFLCLTSAVAQKRCGTAFSLSGLTAQQLSDYHKFNRYVDSVYAAQRPARAAAQLSVGPRPTPNQNTPTYVSPPVLMIPVVFHVVHKNIAESLPDAQLDGQIDILNHDYARMNTDAVNTPTDEFDASAIDIQFYRACIDPSGNPTTGINSHRTTMNRFQVFGGDQTILELKKAPDGLYRWDPYRYLNFWIADLKGWNPNTNTYTDELFGHSTRRF
jgi:hypothetical protein